MRVENSEIKLNKHYWVVDELEMPGNELFEYEFEYEGEWVDKPFWSVFNSRSAAQAAVNMLRKISI